MKRVILILLMIAGATAALRPQTTDSIAEPQGKSARWSVGTNLLYDIAAVPTLTAEVYVGKAWSIQADWMYSWWDYNPKHRYWRVYGGSAGARYWFGAKAEAKPLTGHHVGPVVSVFTYDFEWGGTGYMGGKPDGNIFDRACYSLGLEYGYSLPIKPRLNLDFSLRLGYSGGKYLVYEPIDRHYVWQATKERNWWGPTGMSVTLVWLLGKDNVNH